jgi:hypothetical protein
MTVQRAVSCAGDGDVISLSPSASAPYRGIDTLAANITVKGGSARTTIIDAGQGELNIAPNANATITGVTLTCKTACTGSPTVTNFGRLTLSGDAVTGNTSIPAAAIISTTPDNSLSSAQLTVARSTIANNDSRLGGAIQINTGGGGLGASTLTLVNSTIAHNVSLTQGGGIAALALTPGSGAIVVNSTITQNNASSGGGLYASSPTTLSNTIIASDTAHGSAPPDCQSSSGGAIISDGAGHNVIGNATGCGNLAAGVNGDQAGANGAVLDARLGPLAYNGGTTQTLSPRADSPVIDAGSAAVCEQQPVFDLDQRRVARDATTRDVCDVGAVDTAGIQPHAATALTAVGKLSAVAPHDRLKVTPSLVGTHS